MHITSFESKDIMCIFIVSIFEIFNKRKMTCVFFLHVFQRSVFFKLFVPITFWQYYWSTYFAFSYMLKYYTCIYRRRGVCVLNRLLTLL